ncbi:Glucanosyltransferase-domain-containing protein [Dipodascopsis uninucleata]
MKYLSIIASVAALWASSALADVNPLIIKGNAFFDSKTGERFYMKGVDYQPPDAKGDTVDPLANYKVCSRDIPYIKKLGINTIRVYQVDNAADHSKCMELLQKNGIYLLLDVATSDVAISRDYPEYSYNEVLLQHNFATIDEFKKYTNVIGFVAGNEVVNSVDTTRSATIVKAVIRDMKAYIASQSSRHIPVGYCAADVAENRYELAHYLNCGDEEERAEFFGLNDYSWCGSSSYSISGYNQKVANFNNYSIPVFFSEFGCNLVNPRKFTEVEAIFSSKMTPVFSGGLVYEYVQEANNYGLVKISDDLTEVIPLEDYYTLQNELSKSVPPRGDGGYHANNAISECPDEVEGTWEASNTLPELPQKAVAYLKSGPGAPLGTNGPSNQWTPQKAGAGVRPSALPAAPKTSMEDSITGSTRSSSPTKDSSSTSTVSAASTASTITKTLVIPAAVIGTSILCSIFFF